MPDAAFTARFAAAVDALELPNFSGAEAVATHGGRSRGVANALPPAWGAARLLVVLCYAQALRDEYGGPLRLNSLYRTPAYNAAIGGASLSQHKAATAVDLGCSDPKRLAAAAHKLRGRRIPFTPCQWGAIAAFMTAENVRPSTLFSSVPRVDVDAEGFNARGGIGRYRTFVHVDLRGTPATWVKL